MTTVASVCWLHVSHMNVKNAFLNGDFQEEIYIVPHVEVCHKPGEVCKLKKTLYGLKQGSRAWFEKFSTVITSFGFSSSHHNSTLFFRCIPTILLLVEFAIKDLGPLSYFLGIEVLLLTNVIFFPNLKVHSRYI